MTSTNEKSHCYIPLVYLHKNTFTQNRKYRSQRSFNNISYLEIEEKKRFIQSEKEFYAI
jgi:hypothetical protein